jgi:ring-1,2-phenylacetyl-CoA epoxidase subunit PaaD
VSAATVAEDVRRVLETVYDPELPDVSIVELGLLEHVDVAPRRDLGRSADPEDPADHVVTIDLVPTSAGCPALELIARDVRDAVTALGTCCQVRWLTSPPWSPARLERGAAQRLATEYTVVLRDAEGAVRCPVCGGATAERSAVGPTRGRSVTWCARCRNPVEVLG